MRTHAYTRTEVDIARSGNVAARIAHSEESRLQLREKGGGGAKFRKLMFRSLFIYLFVYSFLYFCILFVFSFIFLLLYVPYFRSRGSVSISVLAVFMVLLMALHGTSGNVLMVVACPGMVAASP